MTPKRNEAPSRSAGPEAARTQRLERLGAAIREQRVAAGLTQSEFGERVAGVPQTTVSRWEGGRVELTVEQVLDIETALQLRPGTLALLAGYSDPERASGDTVGAIKSDPNLDSQHRALLLRVLDVFRGASQASRSSDGA